MLAPLPTDGAAGGPPEPAGSDAGALLDAGAVLDAGAALADPVGATAGAGADAGDDAGGGPDWLGSSPSPVGALARRLDEPADDPPLAVGAE
jgi:hypothetical protein